jgi:hypothetical protein
MTAFPSKTSHFFGFLTFVDKYDFLAINIAYRHQIGPLGGGGGISLLQGHYLHRQHIYRRNAGYNNTVTGIQIHDPSVRAVE